MDGPCSRITQPLNGRVGVSGRAVVVGIVGDRRDAAVESAQHRDQVSDVDVFRTVRGTKRLMHEREVLACRISGLQRHDSGELPLPRVEVRVDEAGDEHAACGIDHNGVAGRGTQVGADLGDARPLDQQVAFGEIADLLIDAQNRAPSDQNASIGILVRP